MRIGLIDVDSKIPNLALMKLSAWRKSLGDTVEWYDPLFGGCDKVYASKVFTFTADYAYYPEGVVKGGTGYGPEHSGEVLCCAAEHICPDYSLYGATYSTGFLTRGCPNKCGWCVVPSKEGGIRANADVSEFLRHNEVVLLDNNVLASDHGIAQIEQLGGMRVKVDFNQGLDARLIDAPMAGMLSNLRWLSPLRLACDSQAQMPHIAKAVKLLREANCTPRNYFCYMLVNDVDEAHDRSEFLRGLGVDPFAQPYRDFTTNAEPSIEQKDFARWVNHKAVWKTVKWEDYRASRR